MMKLITSYKYIDFCLKHGVIITLYLDKLSIKAFTIDFSVDQLVYSLTSIILN